MDQRLLLLILLTAILLVLVALAFSGPDAGRRSTQRLGSLRDRHNDSTLDTKMRKAIAARTPGQQEGMLVSLIPKPELLALRISRTGKPWTLRSYLFTCAGITGVVFLLLELRGYSILSALLLATAIGLGGPHLAVKYLIGKRIKAFTKSFPDALDLLVRGLRSGLPVSETLGVISTEIPGPVGDEFRQITERIKIGMSMDQALVETGNRLDTPEFKFFTITIAIQRETGGNLAETLHNLGRVLRQRAQMKLKISAMSSEAKASAYIIGALPFIVFGLITWINPDYMSGFFTPNPNGLFGLAEMQLIGLGGLAWMSIGAFVMYQMINFDF
jgi:tight adherence protein B